jgi:hypothetical protein
MVPGISIDEELVSENKTKNSLKQFFFCGSKKTPRRKSRRHLPRGRKGRKEGQDLFMFREKNTTNKV